jgi:hypothetical protein
MRTPQLKPIEPAEWFLVRLEDSPWGECYRVVIGFLIVPLASTIWNPDPSGWAVGTVLLVVLGLLRVVPAVARRLWPFSNAVKQIWSSRREIAKRCDSYQWQKLFWVGLGMAFEMLLGDSLRTGEVVIASTCLAAGAAGMIAWRDNGRTERARWVRGERSLA